jgi:hypothetical protein
LVATVDSVRTFGLVVVDACRNNPFLAEMRFTAGGRARVTRGLARVAAHGTTLVAFSAREGQEALDGDTTGNSPFASALAKRLATPGLEVGKLLRQIRVDVLAATEISRSQCSPATPAEDVLSLGDIDKPSEVPPARRPVLREAVMAFHRGHALPSSVLDKRPFTVARNRETHCRPRLAHSYVPKKGICPCAYFLR